MQGSIFCQSFHGHNRTAIHGSLRNTTTKDGGSAGIAGANICQSFPGHNRTAIHGSLRNTTTKDGGSADIAGAKYLPVLPWT